MKTLIFLFSFLYFLGSIPHKSSAQFNPLESKLIGITLGTEYLHKNEINASPSPTIGIYAQLPLIGLISSHSSFFFSQRFYKVVQEDQNLI